MASYTAWQRVKVKVSEIADADDHDSCEVAFGFIEQILTKEGIKHIQGIWKKSVSSPFPPVKPKDNIWPKYTAALNSPRLRRYQDALLDLCLAEDTSRQQYYERIASARMWSARKDLVNACTMKNPGALDGEIQAYKDSHTVRGAKYVAAAEKFGKIYRYGDQYQQGPYGGEKLSRIKTFKHWEKQKSYGRLAHSLGEGILALIPTTGKYELHKYNASAFRKVLDVIIEERGLAADIQTVCAEAQRFMHILKTEFSTGGENLDRLRSLLMNIT